MKKWHGLIDKLFIGRLYHRLELSSQIKVMRSRDELFHFFHIPSVFILQVQSRLKVTVLESPPFNQFSVIFKNAVLFRTKDITRGVSPDFRALVVSSYFTVMLSVPEDKYYCNCKITITANAA